jgi:hypothetical protein
MAAESQQHDLTGEPVDHPDIDHLTKEYPGDGTAKFDIQTSREWYCKHCNNRVTQGADSNGEFGHDPQNCPHHYQGAQR